GRGPRDPGRPIRYRSRPRSQFGRGAGLRARRRSAPARCECAVRSPRPPRGGRRSGFPACARRCQYGPWLASPCCGVDREVLLWGFMPPRQARGQPLHPIYALTRIILPLCLPGFLSAGIFAFTLSQNEFLYALLFLTKSGVRTVPVGVVGELIRGDAFYWGQLMAGALLGSIPVALIYSFFVKYYVAGLTAGAVKG